MGSSVQPTPTRQQRTILGIALRAGYIDGFRKAHRLGWNAQTHSTAEIAPGNALTRFFLFDEALGNLDADLRAQMRVEIAWLRDELRTTMIPP